MENALLLCSLLPTSSYIYHVSLLKVPNFVGDYVYRCHDWVDMCNSRWSGQLRHKTVGVMSQAVERIEIVTFGGNIKPGWYAIFCLVPHMCLAKHVASDMVTRVCVPKKCVFWHVTHVYIYIYQQSSVIIHHVWHTNLKTNFTICNDVRCTMCVCLLLQKDVDHQKPWNRVIHCLWTNNTRTIPLGSLWPRPSYSYVFCEFLWKISHQYIEARCNIGCAYVLTCLWTQCNHESLDDPTSSLMYCKAIEKAILPHRISINLGHSWVHTHVTACTATSSMPLAASAIPWVLPTPHFGSCAPVRTSQNPRVFQTGLDFR